MNGRSLASWFMLGWLFPGLISVANGQLEQREALLQASQKFPFRTWTDNTGNYWTIAKYLRHDQKNVTIMKQNRLVLVVPLSRISQNDVNYLESVSGDKNSNSSNAPSPVTSMLFPDSPAATAKPETVKTLVAPQVAPANPEQLPSPEEKQPDQPQSSTRQGSLNQIPLVEMGLARQIKLAQEGLQRPLANSDYETVKKNLTELQRGWPIEPTEDLIFAVAECAETGDYGTDEIALRLIAATDPKRHLGLLERAVMRNEFSLRSIAYQALTEIKNDRALTALMGKFDSEDCVYVSKFLPQFGNQAEIRLHVFLKHPKMERVLVACSTLGELGTDKSIPYLKELSEKTDKVAIRQQANGAIKRIEQRLGKLESSK